MLTGIAHDFKMVNGKLSFTSGADKSRSNLTFFMMFYATVRVYLHDFTPDSYWMVQKPVSYVIVKSGIYAGRLRAAITKFIPSLTVTKVETVYVRDVSPTIYGVSVSYFHNSTTSTDEAQTVTFI